MGQTETERKKQNRLRPPGTGLRQLIGRGLSSAKSGTAIWRLLLRILTNEGMETDLRNRVVMVTGASGGIGSAVARAFAREHARLVLHYYRGRKAAIDLQRELEPADSILVKADLSKEGDAQKLFETAVKRFGSVDTLIANAGAWEIPDLPMHKMSLAHWQRTMDGVLTNTFLSLRQFLRLVEKQKRGNAVLVASTAAVFGEAGHADYAAAKAAIAYGLTRTLKNEIARIAPNTRAYCGGRINCVCPGWTVVPRTKEKLANPDMIRKAASTMALPRIGRPEDMANAAVFLSSDTLARHITGQILVIAGGMEGRQLWHPSEIDPAIA
jgi:3-oxoacyl-[acyl-carrier protein] reductase